MPTLINIDKSGANKAGIEGYNAAGHDVVPIEVRQRKYLNNRVEQDHPNIKRRVRPICVSGQDRGATRRCRAARGRRGIALAGAGARTFGSGRGRAMVRI